MKHISFYLRTWAPHLTRAPVSGVDRNMLMPITIIIRDADRSVSFRVRSFIG